MAGLACAPDLQKCVHIQTYTYGKRVEWLDRFFSFFGMIFKVWGLDMKDWGTGLGTGVQGKVTEVQDDCPEA